MTRLITASVVAATMWFLLAAPPVLAQAPDCGEYLGLVCQGYFTDEPDLVADDARIEDSIARLVAEHGNEIAVVIASDTRGFDPSQFAGDLAISWGVGNNDTNDGILVLVAVEERRTEVSTQEDISIDGAALNDAAASFFGAGDFEGGVLAIIGVLDQMLTGTFSQPESGSTSDGVSGTLLLAGVGVVAALGIGGGAVASRRRRIRSIESKRKRSIDLLVRRLDVTGGELPTTATYASSHDSEAETPDTTQPSGPVLDALISITNAQSPESADAVRALAFVGAITIVDGSRLESETRVPLRLKVSSERELLETGLQDAIRDAAAVQPADEQHFEVAMMDLETLVAALRPHRVADATERAADVMLGSMISTPAGDVILEHLGSLIGRAYPVLDRDAPLAESVSQVSAAYATASDKVQRVKTIQRRLSVTSTRDVVAVALADVGDDPDRLLAEFEKLRTKVALHGTMLSQDGLSIAAVSALLTLNNSTRDVERFVEGYETLRRDLEPADALEGALAGLFSVTELASARETSDELGIPVSLAVALSERSANGEAAYVSILDEVLSLADGADARVIAAILAISLEPALALDRWSEVRAALSALGLSGPYADIAAAFGASDPRGPRVFALAYAAQRSALEDEGLSNLTRYAPELAHAGTSNQTDTWTGQTLSTSPRDFDPFTFFYLHWAASGGTSGGRGWEALHTSESWKDGGSNWWGGGGGFASSGGGSWTGGSGSSGSFGGFGGGGGFSSGGGGSW